MAGTFDDIIRQILGMNDPKHKVFLMPNRQDEPTIPNILGPEYDNLPPEGGSNVLSYLFPDPLRGYTPRDQTDKAIEDFSRDALAKGTYK